jgi:acetyl-CoA C-acetyltransferase
MIETAENLRRQYGIPRGEQDELAVTSHRRAVAAQKEGLLADQIIPATVTSRSAWGFPRLRWRTEQPGDRPAAST